MSLLLGQLVYTSFPKVGLTTLASAQVPTEAQQAFIQQVVYQRWNSYDPPGLRYRAVYLHQVSSEETLFGWLYNDGLDDIGRSDVPYFVCYYLAEQLHPVQLESILTCLHRGPVALMDRQRLPATSETIVTSNCWSYQPARMGVAIPSDVSDRSHAELKQGRLLDLFIPADEREIGIELNVQTCAQQRAASSPNETHQLVIEGIEADVVDPKERVAKAGALKSHDEYQEILQLYAQALKDPPSTGTTTVGLKEKALTALIPSYRSFRLLTGIGIAAALALTVTMYELYQWQSSKLPQAIDTLEAKTGWHNVQAQSLSGHLDSVWSVAISPDGQTLASSSEDKTIKVWNLQNGESQRTLSGYSDTVRSVAISPDGQTLVSGSGDKTIRIQSLGTGELLHTLSGHSAPVWSVAISPDGQTLASGSGDKTIKIWNLQSGELLNTLSGHSDWVFSVAISPDGQTLISGSKDKTIKIWDLQSGELLHTLSGHSDAVRSVAISPDGQTLVSGSWDQIIKVWNLQSGELLHTLSGHSDRVVAVAISPDGQTLVSGGLDQTIKIWNLQSGELLHTLSGHSDWVLSIAISSDGQTLVSSSKDRTIKVQRQ